MLNPLQKAAIRHLVAYEYSPPETRMEHTQFAELLNISVRTMQRWQQDAEFKAALQAARDEAEASRDPFATFARQWSIEQLFALYSKAKTTNEKRQLLKEVLSLTDHVADYQDAVDYSDMSDEDLAAAILNRGLSAASMTEAELFALAKGATQDAVPADTGGVPECAEPGADGDDAAGPGAARDEPAPDPEPAAPKRRRKGTR